MRLALVLLAFGSSVLAAGCASLGSHPPRATDLSGEWRLDESLSDDPRALIHQQQHPRGSGHGMHHHGGMPGLAMPGGHSGGSWGGGHRGPNSEFLARPTKLSIRQSPSRLELVADGVSTDFVYGEKVMASVQGGGAERSSGWKGKDFVVKYDVTDGPKATRSYEVDDGGKQLIVTTQVAGGRGPEVKFHLVYARTG